MLGSTGNRIADENTPVNPTPLVAHRMGLEQNLLACKRRHVRTVVIRPAVVYGRGGGSLLVELGQSARQFGAARYVGDGNSRWSLVDVDDLAQLYVLALEKAPSGSILQCCLRPILSNP